MRPSGRDNGERTADADLADVLADYPIEIDEPIGDYDNDHDPPPPLRDEGAAFE